LRVGRFELWDVLSCGTFSDGTFWMRRFKSGRFVCAPEK
jgi:hypothetical protein